MTTRRIRPSGPVLPHPAPKRGSPEAGLEPSSLASGAPAQLQATTPCAGVDVGVPIRPIRG
jgi:hypothetical protein